MPAAAWVDELGNVVGLGRHVPSIPIQPRSMSIWTVPQCLFGPHFNVVLGRLVVWSGSQGSGEVPLVVPLANSPIGRRNAHWHLGANGVIGRLCRQTASADRPTVRAAVRWTERQYASQTDRPADRPKAKPQHCTPQYSPHYWKINVSHSRPNARPTTIRAVELKASQPHHHDKDQGLKRVNLAEAHELELSRSSPLGNSVLDGER